MTATFQDVTYPRGLYTGGIDDLHVTAARNHRECSTDGGVSGHRCRWHDNWSDDFGCFFYDTERPEGNMADSDKWGYDTGQSQLAAPFVSFTFDAKRMALFPGPVTSALKPAGHATAGVFATWVKAVAEGENVRAEGAGLWSSGDYDRAGTTTVETDDSVLQIEICGDAGWVLADGANRSCGWLSANETRLADRLGFDAD
ncbi:hypothetical protein [Candidatus Poriferisodalis sp.]|uniref:hypothetical protein n=1 Tax=Candidatus Poriferisodalis sp. TaxID=3101277 RepID=UPI003AF9813D